MYQTLRDIFGRRSIRAFKPEQITEEALSAVLQAGRAAPSSMNRQPWHFTVVQSGELLDKIVAANREVVASSPELAGANPWINAPHYHNFYRAPTVIFISGQRENYAHACDCALAMENMALAAHSLSLGSCIIASVRFAFQSEHADALMAALGIPKGFFPLHGLSLGYPEGDTPPPTPRREDCVNYIRSK